VLCEVQILAHLKHPAPTPRPPATINEKTTGIRALIDPDEEARLSFGMGGRGTHKPRSVSYATVQGIDFEELDQGVPRLDLVGSEGRKPADAPCVIGCNEGLVP